MACMGELFLGDVTVMALTKVLKSEGINESCEVSAQQNIKHITSTDKHIAIYAYKRGHHHIRLKLTI